MQSFFVVCCLASLLQPSRLVAVWSMSVIAWQSILVSKFLRSMQSVVFGFPAVAQQTSCSVEHVGHSVAFNTYVQMSALRAVMGFRLVCYSSAAKLQCGLCLSQRGSQYFVKVPAQHAVSGFWLLCYSSAAKLQSGAWLHITCGIQYLCPNACATCSQWILAFLLQPSGQVAVFMVYVHHSVAFNTCVQMSAQRTVSAFWLLCYSAAAKLQCGVCLSCRLIQHLCPDIYAVWSQWFLAFLLQPSSQVAVWNMSVPAWHSILVYKCLHSVQSVNFGSSAIAQQPSSNVE